MANMILPRLCHKWFVKLGFKAKKIINLSKFVLTQVTF